MARMFVAACAFATMLCGSGVALAQDTQYAFTRIVDTTHNPGFAKPSCVGLNDAGMVIVQFTPSVGTTLEVWKGQGGPFLPVALNVLRGCPSINDRGQIAYRELEPATGTAAVVLNEDGAITVLAHSDVAFPTAPTAVPLNNNGQVVYFAGTTSALRLYLAPGGIPVSDASITIPGYSVGAGGLADNGMVGFLGAQTLPGGDRVEGIYFGSVVPLVAAGTPVLNGTLRWLFTPVVNNTGLVAFVGAVWDAVKEIEKVYAFTTRDGLALTPVGSGNIEGLAVNEDDTVAFSRRNGGLYISSATALDRKLIKPGDPLDGSMVERVALWPEALNNRGQIAFYAKLKDGRHGVYRADPIGLSDLFFTSTIPACETIVGRVQLQLPAPVGGLTLSLDNSNPAVSMPSSLTIPEGRSKATFEITPTPVRTAVAGTIRVTAGAQSLSRDITVRPIGLKEIWMYKAWIGGTPGLRLGVQLDCGAAPDDIVATITTSNPAVARPAVDTLLFPAGGGHGQLGTDVETSPVEQPTKVTMTVSANGITRKRNVTIYPKQP